MTRPVNQSLANTPASDNHHLARPPTLILIVAPFSSKLSRYMLWTLRTWHITVHERMNEDPVVFALKDRFSLGLAAISAVLLVTAWLP